MNGCSRKKAETIIKMRPFNDWEELVIKQLKFLIMCLYYFCAFALVRFIASELCCRICR